MTAKDHSQRNVCQHRFSILIQLLWVTSAAFCQIDKLILVCRCISGYAPARWVSSKDSSPRLQLEWNGGMEYWNDAWLTIHVIASPCSNGVQLLQHVLLCKEVVTVSHHLYQVIKFWWGVSVNHCGAEIAVNCNYFISCKS